MKYSDDTASIEKLHVIWYKQVIMTELCKLDFEYYYRGFDEEIRTSLFYSKEGSSKEKDENININIPQKT